VRANYRNDKLGIEYTPIYLERFFRNLLLGESWDLKSRYLYLTPPEEWKVQPQTSVQTAETSDKNEKVADKTAKVADKNKKVADKTPNKIIQIIISSPTITTIQIAEQLHMSDSGVRKVITALKKRGIITRIGANKNGHWEVLKEEDAL